MNESQGTPRREWPRIPVPPALFDLLIMMGRAHKYSERTLYRFLLDAIRQGYPEDFEKLKGYVDLDALDNTPD